jgi:TetR/AcrR family transcriptional regulator, mexCD-oprJ operon repressor
MAELDAVKGRRRDAARSVEAILDAALDVLAERPDASMADIAEEAGLVRATVYAHFPNREALLRGVLEQALGQVAADLDALRLERDEPVAALERVIHVALGGIARLGRAREAVELGLGMAAVEDARRGLLDRHRQLVRRGQRAGAFRRDLPPDWLAEVFAAMVDATYRAVQREEVSREEAPELLRKTVFAAYGISA